jgi:hypothetical protein
MMRVHGQRSRLFTLLALVGLLLASLPGGITQAADSRATSAVAAQQVAIQAAGAVRVDFTVDGYICVGQRCRAGELGCGPRG